MKYFALLFVGFAAIPTACNLYPGDNARTEELDVIVTHFDPAVDFSQFTTYALAPEIKPVSSSPNDPPNFEISPELNDIVIQTIEANMAAYGWTKVDTSDNPDLAIDLGATVTRNTNVYGTWPGYGWGYPGYGWGYPWPTYSTVTSYQVGSIIMVGLDLNNIDTVNQIIPAMWHGLVQGPLINNVDDQIGRVERDINQAFDQSPYLNVNP
jgi:hypothetical protein